MSFIMNKQIRDGLGPEDLRRMNIGRRWWGCMLSKIPDGLKYKTVLTKYIANIADHIRNGRGLMFRGDYSSGKTGAAVIVAKAVVSHGGTAYFMTTSELSDSKIEKQMFDEEEGTTVWDRMRKVDLLILDDLGSDHIGKSQWGKSLVERILRIRSNKTKALVCTTNKFDEITEVYGESTLAVLRACTLATKVEGKNWRDEEQEELSREILGDTK